jgi:hypothetical protein
MIGSRLTPMSARSWPAALMLSSGNAVAEVAVAHAGAFLRQEDDAAELGHQLGLLHKRRIDLLDVRRVELGPVLIARSGDGERPIDILRSDVDLDGGQGRGRCNHRAGEYRESHAPHHRSGCPFVIVRRPAGGVAGQDRVVVQSACFPIPVEESTDV